MTGQEGKSEGWKTRAGCGCQTKSPIVIKGSKRILRRMNENVVKPRLENSPAWAWQMCQHSWNAMSVGSHMGTLSLDRRAWGWDGMGWDEML